MENEFETMSLHQQVGFLHDFFKRIQIHLNQRPREVLGRRDMSDDEVLAQTEVYRAILFALDDHNRASVQSVYKKLNPTRLVTLPDPLDYQSFIVFFHARVFLQHWPSVQTQRLFAICRKALLALQAINRAESRRLESAVEFFEDTMTLRFRFKDRTLLARTNKQTDMGFELKQDLDSASKAKRRPIVH